MLQDNRAFTSVDNAVTRFRKELALLCGTTIGIQAFEYIQRICMTLKQNLDYLNEEFREKLLLSMDSASRDAHTLTDRNVLIFDDITSNEDSISRAVDLIIDCYAPKSVTGFMLFSPYNKDRGINPPLNL